MKTSMQKNDLIKLVLTIISVLSVLGISAGNIIFDNDIYLPLVQNQDPTPTITQTPTSTPTPEPTVEVTPEPTVDPPPEGTRWVIVNPDNEDKDWALAYFQKGENNNGYPIMEIYPGDSSAVEDRIKIPRDEQVLVYSVIVRADGVKYFWKLVDYHGDDGEELYIRDEDVILLVQR